MRGTRLSKLLFTERHIVYLPSLANALKDTEQALLLQQIHFWEQDSIFIAEGKKWVKRSIEDWQKEFFRHLTKETIRRKFENLKKRNLLVAKAFGGRTDRVLAYRINYDAILKIL